MIPSTAALPHYRIYREPDGVHVVVDSFDPARGPSHIDHVEPSWPGAWDWVRIHHRLVGGLPC